MIFKEEDLLYEIQIGLLTLGIFLTPTGDLELASFNYNLGNSKTPYTEVIMRNVKHRMIRTSSGYGFGLTGSKRYLIQNMWICLEKEQGALFYKLARDSLALDKKKFIKEGLFLNPIAIKTISLKRDQVRSKLKQERLLKWK